MTAMRAMAAVLLLTAGGTVRADDPDTLEVLQKLGAVIGFDKERPGQPAVSLRIRDVTLTPAGVKDIAGLAELREVTFEKAALWDGALKELAALPRLRKLSLRESTFDAADLRGLAGARALEELDLSRTRNVTSALVELPKLDWLRSLILEGTSVGEPELKLIAQNKKLERLSLHRCTIRNQGLKELSALKGLRALDLSRCELATPSLASLADCKELRELNLSGLDKYYFKADSLEVLADLPQLEKVDLAGTRITEKGLNHFAGLSALKDLDLSGCGLSTECVATLRDVLPKCRVHY
jgi:hypothetical protein